MDSTTVKIEDDPRDYCEGLMQVSSSPRLFYFERTPRPFEEGILRPNRQHRRQAARPSGTPDRPVEQS